MDRLDKSLLYLLHKHIQLKTKWENLKFTTLDMGILIFTWKITLSVVNWSWMCSSIKTRGCLAQPLKRAESSSLEQETDNEFKAVLISFPASSENKKYFQCCGWIQKASSENGLPLDVSRKASEPYLLEFLDTMFAWCTWALWKEITQQH